MARQRYRRTSSLDEFDTSLMYDDIEKIRELEEEEEKDQNNKLSFAGMMALVAGAALFITGALGGLLPPDLTGFLMGALPVVGFGALGYGFYKTLKLAFRQKELSFPTLNVYRKTKPIPINNEGTEGTRTAAKEAADARAQYVRRRARTRTRTNPRTRPTQSTDGKKILMRSRRDKVFSGVAGGLAEYMGVSPALVRFAFIAGLFAAGPMPVFAYLLLSIILPPNYSREYQERNSRSTRMS
ncbi:MAG: PspC domain-containing protein [Bacteroidota bacterium]